MFEKKLQPEDFLLDPFVAAKDVLLGAYLCSNIGGKFCAGKITELEVYIGAEDKACHAYKNKKTLRNSVMFEKGGKAYVFFVYGMHNQFNVVTNEEGVANAILIRSLEPVVGIDVMKERRGVVELLNLTTGPGKLCKALGIDRSHNGISLTGDELWISPKDTEVKAAESKRIGIDYAEEYRDKLWRFFAEGSKFVSKNIKK